MKARISISIFWLVFAILFFCLAWCHWAESKQIIPDFEIDIRSTGLGVKIIGVDFREFVNKFNAYVANQNELNLKANLFACGGYFLAGCAALVSCLVCRNISSHTGEKPKDEQKQ